MSGAIRMMQTGTRSFVSRALGVGLAAAGAAVAWFFGLQPLAQAQLGAPTVTLSMKAFVVAPMMMVCGLALLAGGTSVANAMSGPPRGRQQHVIVWAMFALSLGLGAAAWWWMRGQLHALNYMFG